MLESLNYSFRNQKNIIWVIYRIKQLRNYKKKKIHGVLRGPQFDKQLWRARFGILRVNWKFYAILLQIQSQFLYQNCFMWYQSNHEQEKAIYM